MSYLAGYLVNASSHDDVIDAVRNAYVERGAVESAKGGLTVRIGKPTSGWSLVIDSTHHTVDMGVAEAVANALAKRVAVFGSRGSGSRGRGSLKVFGAWKPKPPGSLTPAKLRDRINGLAKVWPMPWEIETRPGVVLSFDIAKMKRVLGPFKDNDAAVLREAHEYQQKDAMWHVSSSALNKHWDDAHRALDGIVDRWGWQSAYDHHASLMQTNLLALDGPAAKLTLALAGPAFEGVTASKFVTTWLLTQKALTHAAYMWSPIVASAVLAGDAKALAQTLDALDDDEIRQRVALDAYARHSKTLAKAKLWATLQRDLPVDAAFAWLLTPKGKDGPLADGAKLAATRSGPLAQRVLDHAKSNLSRPHFGDQLARKALELARAREFRGALALFDLIVELPDLDGTSYGNALWAVQADNNKLPLDEKRARRYLAACEPHGADNEGTVVNAVCVRFELGDLAGCFETIAKGRQDGHALESLRTEALLAPLRKDPRFAEAMKRRKAK